MSTEQPTTKLAAGTGGSIEALLAQIEKFIDQTPLRLGWRIAEQVEAHNSAVVDCQYVEWLHVRSFLRLVLAEISAVLLTRRDHPEQWLKDAAEIRSSYGFLLMRLAVAKDAQDTYNVCKREFTEHEAAFKRLGIVVGQEQPDSDAAIRRDAPQEPQGEDLARVEPLSSAPTDGIYRTQSPGAVTAAERTEKP